MLNYPDVADSSRDRYDIAYEWGWNTPELRDVVYNCYKTPNFEENARRFFSSGEFQDTVRLLSEMGKAPSPQIRVLDFGCGNGIASYSLSRLGYSVIGVDSSLGDVAGLGAAQKLLGLDGAQFELRHSTGEAIAFPDESFDIVWIREALHHITQLTSFLTDIRRILKPDGILCCLRDVVIWNEQQRDHFFATHPFQPITQDEGCYYLPEYLEAFQQANFLVERVLNPCESLINTYPRSPNPFITFDPQAAQQRQQGYDLFSFFVRKPLDIDTFAQWSNDATRYLNEGKPNQALCLLDTLLRHEPRNKLSLYSKSVALARLGQYTEAVNTLSNLLNEHPELVKPQLLRDHLLALTPSQEAIAPPPVPCASGFNQSSALDRAEADPQTADDVSWGQNVQVVGRDEIRIGSGSCIADQAWLNVCTRDRQIRMVIGRCVLIGRQSVISSAGYLEIGDFCLLAPRVLVSNADHVFDDIYRPYLEQGASADRQLIVEENCWLGINSVVTGDLVIGRGSVVAANSVVTKDVPPFCVVAGSPAHIIKMYNPLSGQWERTVHDGDRQRVAKIREMVGLPSRETYRMLLQHNAAFRQVSPVLAGCDRFTS